MRASNHVAGRGYCKGQSIKCAGGRRDQMRTGRGRGFCAKWLFFGCFAQAKGKIRVIFEAFLNGFEQFFAKIDEFRTIFCVFERKLSGFLQVGDTDYTEYTDWARWVKDN